MVVDFEAEAEFWQLRYFELMVHTNQIITALSRPLLNKMAMQQLAQQAQSQAQVSVPVPQHYNGTSP